MKIDKSISLLLLILIFFPTGICNAYPDKPITVIVHTKPGGAVDLMVRQVALIAGKYIDQPLVVVNKPGGSGRLALAHVYGRKADGYTLLAFPAAFLAPIQTTDLGFSLDDFHYIACLTISPEAIFTNPNAELVSWEQLYADALENPGRQKWCGPGSGSLDHLMAVKIWDAAGISARWIPYSGGGSAAASVMGRHNDVYVGNPEDIIGREDNMHLAAVASVERLNAFPDTPAFLELGIDLTDDVMWRGFAVRKGTDAEKIAILEELLWKCVHDTLWYEYIAKTKVQPVFITGNEFKERVDRDARSSQKYLKMAGFSLGSEPDSADYPLAIFGGLLAVVFGGVYFGFKSAGRGFNGTAAVSAFFLAMAILFYYMSTYFPEPVKGFIGASTVPRIWAILLVTLSLGGIIKGFKSDGGLKKNEQGRIMIVVILLGLMIAYVIAINLFGFFPSTFLLLVGGMYLLGSESHSTVLITSGAVIAVMYLAFIELLSVPLPIGILFQ
ncbi:MAG: hypothetical protein GF307_10925 [candidate division Zixibacteria bacterium]|nr:hypothetical protein [candidate division Zixibacteria bacterium]